MAEPTHHLDPMRGSLRWAWKQAPRHRDRFAVSVVILGLASVAISNLETIPAGASSGQRIGYTSIGFLAAVLLAVATSIIWALVRAPFEQRDALRETVLRLRTQLQSEAPELEGSIQQVMTGHVRTDAGAEELRLLVTVTVLNRGTASLVDNWKVTFIQANGRRHELPLIKLSPHMDLPIGNGKFVSIADTDAIYEKAQHVDRGTQIRGFLQAGLQGFRQDEFHQNGNTVEISFTDFTGRAYRVVSEPLKGGPSDPFMYYPGTSKFTPQPVATRRRKRRSH
jgi:hypothetical protein